MTTDPGDLVLDPTCGSGTTAYVAEQWGRRWITIDTSRVALRWPVPASWARAIRSTCWPTPAKASSRKPKSPRTRRVDKPVHGNIRHGFVYERVPHITLKSIANNAEIDVIWDKWQAKLEPLREKLNAALKQTWQEWEIPREADAKWPDAAKKLHADWWEARIARQKEIDASIAAKAEFEYLYDKPYEDKKKVRVAGPFTVESLCPHRVLGVDENDELIDPLEAEAAPTTAPSRPSTQMILENLKTAGVQQAHKEDRITFTALTPWPGDLVCAEGRYLEGETREARRHLHRPRVRHRQPRRPRRRRARGGRRRLRRADRLRLQLRGPRHRVQQAGPHPGAQGAHERRPPHGRRPEEHRQGQPLRHLRRAGHRPPRRETDGKLRVKVNGVDVFDPQHRRSASATAPTASPAGSSTPTTTRRASSSATPTSSAPNDPYSALKTTLKAEIDEEAWATLNSDTSRPFDKPKSGRIAVKVINHLGDEVMKVFRV